MQRSVMRYLLGFTAIIIIICLLFSCANQVRPNGGQKDTTPPQIISSFPPNETVNFNSHTITMEFDEYVTVSASKIIVTPNLNKPLLIKNKGKRVEIEFQEELAPNTTYLIQFADAIKDVNEGNSIAADQFVLSTGTFLDSLELTGTVIDQQTGQWVGNATVALYNNKVSDSAIINAKPNYITKTDDQGKFKFKYLKNNKYKLFFLQDENNSQSWQQGESLGVVESVLVTDSVQSLTVFIYPQQEENQPVKQAKLRNGVLTWESGYVNMEHKWELLYPGNQTGLVYIKPKDDNIHQLWISPDVDSVSVVFNLGTLTDTVHAKSRSDDLAPLILLGKRNKNTSIALNPKKNIELTFNHVLNSMDQAQISVKENDSIPVQPDINTQNETISLSYNWKLNTSYFIEILPNTIKDWYNQQNTDTIRVLRRVGDENDYGNLEIKLENWTSNKSYELLLKNDAQKLISQKSVTDRTVLFKSLEAASYFITVFEDQNGNKTWNPGNVFSKLKSEPIYHYKAAIQVRGNWDVSITMKLED